MTGDCRQCRPTVVRPRVEKIPSDLDEKTIHDETVFPERWVLCMTTWLVVEYNFITNQGRISVSLCILIRLKTYSWRVTSGRLIKKEPISIGWKQIFEYSINTFLYPTSLFFSVLFFIIFKTCFSILDLILIFTILHKVIYKWTKTENKVIRRIQRRLS